MATAYPPTKPRVMELILKDVASLVARGCELTSVLFVALGAGEALLRSLLRWRDYGDLTLKKDIWRRFAAAILLALEFALAADIARTAIAPSWQEIGELAAIAAIRTALNWFLERDLESARGGADAARPAPTRRSARPKASENLS